MRMVEGEAFLAGAKRMDRMVLGQLYDAYFPGLYRYVFFRVGDQQTSSAITGQIFRDLLVAIGKNRGPQRNLAGWLYRAAADRVQALQEIQAPPVVESSAGPSGSEFAAADMPDGNSWQQMRLQSIFQQLEPEQQHVLALRFSNMLSLDEITQIMAKPARKVKEIQFEALKALERSLQSAI